jgi:hypothetical protein
MITVGELKAMLDEFDDDRIVVVSYDMEGNGYTPLEAITWGAYFPETEYSGDFVDSDDLEDDENINRTESEPAIVLWPSN